MSFDPKKVKPGEVYIDDLGQEILVTAIDGRGGYIYFRTEDLDKPAPSPQGPKAVTLLEDVKADPRQAHIKKHLEKWEARRALPIE